MYVWWQVLAAAQTCIPGFMNFRMPGTERSDDASNRHILFGCPKVSSIRALFGEGTTCLWVLWAL